jgi:hypothetical protein
MCHTCPVLEESPLADAVASRIYSIFDAEEYLPAWVRPTYRGGVFILGIAIGRTGKLLVTSLLASLMLMTGVLRGAGVFLAVEGATMLAGAAAGTMHGILGWMDRYGRPGAWIQWAASLFVFMAALTLVGPMQLLSLDEPLFYPMAGSLAALGALAMILDDDRRPGRPSPREFRLLQGRIRLLGAPHRMWLRLRRNLLQDDRDGLLTGTGHDARAAELRLLERRRADLLRARRALTRAPELTDEAKGDLQEVDARLARLDRDTVVLTELQLPSTWPAASASDRTTGAAAPAGRPAARARRSGRGRGSSGDTAPARPASPVS